MPSRYKLMKQKKTFDERLQNINFETYFKDLPFNPSALIIISMGTNS